MIDDREHCHQKRLSLFIDGEIDPEESQRIDRHLQQCPECRRYVRQQRDLARQIRREISAARQAVDFERLEKQIVQATGSRPALVDYLRQSLLSWKLLVPVAATATLALFLFTNLFQPPPPPGPSAIINSFTGKVSSVMILETPQRHQTVIWYSEEVVEGNGTQSQKL